MADTAPVSAPTPADDPGTAAPLPYYAGATARRRSSVWVRAGFLAAAWVLAVVALFMPGCDMSSSADRSSIAPTYAVYGLTYWQVREAYDRGRDSVVSGNPSAMPETSGVAGALACALFPLGSAVFLFTPLLLRRRLRGRFGWGSWTLSSLLLAPWALLLIAAASGSGQHYLYGYYLLAVAQTIAFAVLLWPDRRIPG